MNQRYFILCFFTFLASLPLAGQLKKGDQFLGFGQPIAFRQLAYSVPLSDNLFSIGSASGTSQTSQLFMIPNYGFMANDWLHLHGAFQLIGNGPIQDIESFGLTLGARGYLTNGPGDRMYVGMDYLLLSGSNMVRKSVSGIYPNLGYAITVGGAAQLSNEVGFLVANKDFPTQLLVSSQLSFLLTPEGVAERVTPDYRRGSLMLGIGGLSFARVFSSGDKQLLITPEVHYFFTNTTAAGLKLRYQHVPIEDWNFKGQGTVMGAGLNLRQFFSLPGRRFAPFAQIGANYNDFSGKLDYSYYSPDSFEGNFFTFDAALGGLIFLRPTLALELGVGYSSMRSDKHPRLDDERAVALTFGGRFLLPTGSAE
jgi:hypothetical protein